MVEIKRKRGREIDRLKARTKGWGSRELERDRER